MSRAVLARLVIAALVAAGMAQQALSQDTPARQMIRKAKALADAGGGGRFPAEMVTDASLPVHVIFRPRNIASAGKLPIVAWGNGGCFNRGDIYRYLLIEIASHGYLVLASGALGTNDLDEVFASVEDPIDPAAQVPDSPGRAVAAPLGPNDAAKKRLLPLLLTNTPISTSTAQMKESIDWALAENDRRGSPYYHRLDPKRIAVMGVSCGGMQAIELSSDPRVTTTIVWNSGTLPKSDSLARMGVTGVKATQADVLKFHGPVAYISGDESDIAFKGANRDFDAITAVPALRAYKKGIGHDGTYVQPAGGAYGKVGIAWLEWQFRKDAAAAHMFKGADCTLCTDPDWTILKKMIN